MGKDLPARQERQETWVRSLGWEDPLEEDVTTYCSILAWRIPWTEELVGYSPWGHKEADTTAATEHTGMHGSLTLRCIYFVLGISFFLMVFVYFLVLQATT